MSNAKRKGLEFTANQIGKALAAIENLVGTPDTPETNRLQFENNFLKLRGSTFFYDYDVSKKSTITRKSAQYNTFDGLDIAQYTIQGGSIGVSYNLTTFKNPENWDPQYTSPPTPEGWGIYDYNAWSNYIPEYNSSNAPNSDYIIYNPYGEPGSGIARTQYSFPVRWSSSGSTYQRVPYFKYGMFVSLFNADTGSSTINSVSLAINKNYFSDFSNVNPFTNCPEDLLIYSHSNLISDTNIDPITLDGTMGIGGSSDALDCLSFSIVESDAYFNTNTINQDHYYFEIDLPNNYSWDLFKYRYFVFYWGSHDPYVKTLKTETIGNTDTIQFNGFNTDYISVFPKKLFFDKKVGNSLYFNKTGINDTNVYFYNSNDIQNTFKELKYEPVLDPFRYKINETIAGSDSGYENSLIGFENLNENEFLPFIIASKNSGLYYDDPKSNLEIFAGKSIQKEEIPVNWDDFTGYPTIPVNYKPISKVIVAGGSKNRTTWYPDNINQIFNDLSVVYIKMVADNALTQSVSDSDFIEYFIDSFLSYATKIRSYEYRKPLLNIGQRLISRFAGYDTNKIRTQGHFLSATTLEYISIHNLLKAPSNSNLINTNDTEPRNIQFDNNSSKLVGYFASTPPSSNFVGIGSSLLYLNDFKLNTDNSFEVYLEANKDISTNGTQKDYVFRVKFNNIKKQKTIKDVFVNASTYFLTTSEYNKRKSKNLYTDGYFTSSTLKNIDDYSLYGEAALIADLKFGAYKPILNKQNAPTNPKRLTEQQYEETVKAKNPNITKDGLIASKTGFGLTDSFYVEDLTFPPNAYSSIEEVSLSTTNFRYKTNSYWINNTDFLYGLGISTDIKNAVNINDLRSDSFIIAPVGYYPDDTTLNSLENIGDQQIVSSIASTINHLEQNNVQSISNNKLAFKIICDETQDIKSIILKLRSYSDFINANSVLTADLYTDENNAPSELLIKSSQVYLKSITNKLKNFTFYIDYKLFKDKTYWVVLNISQLPPQYDPYAYGLVSVNDASITGVYNVLNNTYTNFSRYLVGAEIGIGSTNPSLINNWYAISSIASSSSMTVASTGTTLSRQPYSIRYKFEIGVEDENLTGADKNIYIYNSGTGWTNIEGTPYLKFCKPDDEIYGAFNKDYTNSTLIIAPPNRYRSTSNYVVDEYWAFNNKEIFEPTQLAIYPRSVNLNKLEIIGSGVAGSNFISVKEIDYSDKILVGLGISQTSNFSSGTSITSILYNSTNKTYNLVLNQPILSNFSSNNVGIGTEYITYIKRANDIYLSVSYYKNGGLATSNYLLEKSPTWITKWYSKNRFTYNELTKDIQANFITNTYDLNFNNYNVYGNSSYVNGFAIANFKPLSGIGTSFDFKFVCSGGIRVYLNDSVNASLDYWKTTASIGYSFSHSIGSTSENIKFEVQFNKTTNSAGVGLTLQGYWKVSGTGTWYPLNDTFYIDPVMSPTLIDSEVISSIKMLKVGRTLSSITADLPYSDKLVIRSS